MGNEWRPAEADGRLWRHARDEWLESGWGTRAELYAALVDYEAPWIEENTPEEHRLALQSTHRTYFASLADGETLDGLLGESPL